VIKPQLEGSHHPATFGILPVTAFDLCHALLGSLLMSQIYSVAATGQTTGETILAPP
jgi:hypothetical protein